MAKRIEKLDNERWKGWDWAASNKLNEVIEAVNTLTERVMELEASAVMKEPAPWPTQVEPDKITTEVPKFPSYYSKDDILIPSIPSEPDTEQVDREIAASIQWLADEYVLPKNRDEFVDDALDVAEKIRNLLKGQS